MRIAPLLLAGALCGCHTSPEHPARPDPNRRTIKFESDPPGGRVFMQAGSPGFVASSGKNFLGTTPCTWKTESRDDGTFKVAGSKIPVFSKFTQALVVFTCEPPSSQTNLYTRKETFRCQAKFQPGTAIPDGIFFVLTKPPP